MNETKPDLSSADHHDTITTRQIIYLSSAGFLLCFAACVALTLLGHKDIGLVFAGAASGGPGALLTLLASTRTKGSDTTKPQPVTVENRPSDPVPVAPTEEVK